MYFSFDTVFSWYYNSGSSFYDFSADCNEIIYFVNGNGYTIINGEKYNYSSDGICVTRNEDVRDHVCINKTNYICIRFNGNIGEDIISSGVYKCTKDMFFSLFTDVFNEYKLKKNNYFEMCNAKIKEIIVLLSRQKEINNVDKCMYDLLNQLDENFTDYISVQQMADKVSYSYDYFRHRFKEITGQSPTNYIINKRVEYACKLLKEQDYSCTEISELCGFSTSAQFSKIFKDKTGMSPVKYKLK